MENLWYNTGKREKGAAFMAVKLSARERALMSFGDYLPSVEALEARIKQIEAQDRKEEREAKRQEREAKRRNDAPVYKWGGQSFQCDLPEIISPDEVKKEKAPAEIRTQKRQEAKPAKQEEKRGRGRPRKNGKGSQTTIWVTDEMRQAVNQYAQYWRVSFSDAVSKLLQMGMRK